MSLKKIFDEENKNQYNKDFVTITCSTDERTSGVAHRISVLIDEMWDRYNIARETYSALLCKEKIMGKLFSLVMELKEHDEGVNFQAIYLEPGLPSRQVRIYSSDHSTVVPKMREVVSEDSWEGKGILSVEGIMAEEGEDEPFSVTFLVMFREGEFFLLDKDATYSVIREIRKIYPRIFAADALIAMKTLTR